MNLEKVELEMLGACKKVLLYFFSFFICVYVLESVPHFLNWELISDTVIFKGVQFKVSDS